jgi:hypothetical protein
MAGLALVLLATPAGAQPAHRYVNVAVTTLPEPGDPEAVVFADIGAASRADDVVALDVIYALGETKTIEGRDTIYALFKYKVACAAKTLELPRYEIHGPGGAVQTTASNDPAHPPATPTDAAILGLVCGSKPAPTGYADLKDVLLHASDFARTQREHDPKLKHSFVLTGAANGTQLGAFNLYIDTATLDRSGDQVTVQSVQVFREAIGPSVPPGAYVINTVTFDCAAKTSTTPFVVLYRADGTPLETGLTGNPAKPTPPDTVNEKMLNLACHNADPGYAVAPYATLAATLAGAERSLSAKTRR